MPKPTSSVPPLTERERALIAAIVDQLDADYPAVVIAPRLPDIGEPSRWYDGRRKPDFVLADDEGWR
jgi:hypothetical protein